MTGLFWYKILFMTELLIAESLFFFRLEKRSRFVIRVICCYALCYLAAVFFPLNTEISYTAWYVSLMFFVLFFVSLLCFFFVFKISFLNAFFCTVTAYTAQHLSYELVSLVFSMFGVAVGKSAYGDQPLNFAELGGGTFWFIFGYIDIFVLIYGIIYIVLARRMEKGSVLKIKSYSLLLLSGLILLVDIILNASVIYVEEGYSSVYETVTCIYNIISCILVFYIQVSMITIKDLRNEMETIGEILRQSNAQYASTKKNIDLINMKCHDLKYQIRQFAERGVDDETVKEIENLIAIYDAKVKTGNEVLDVILTEKSLECYKNGIKLSCMTDCAALDFVKEGDLFVLFGNLIDNAIEAVGELDDPDKKCIGLNVHTEKGFISISTENYFKGGIKYSEDGLPATTKSNGDFHGFGIKSMRTVVEQYGGNLNVVISDDIFRLNIIIPVKTKK